MWILWKIRLAERVFELCVLLEHIIGERVVETIQDFVSAIIEEMDRRSLRRLDRPEMAIGEEQLCFLIEQGFRIKDIADMFGCSRRTVERKMEKYHLSIFTSFLPLVIWI